MAYEIVDQIFPEKSVFWQTENHHQATGFLSFLTDPNHSNSIKSAISDVQKHKDIVQFLEELHPVFDGILLILAHSFSLADSYPDQLSVSEVMKSAFVDDKTIALVNYARKKYREDDFCLSDGKDYIMDFVRIFNIEFSDLEQNLICYVDF